MTILKVPHSKCCINYSGPPIKVLDKTRPIPEKLIAKTQRSMVVFSSGEQVLPYDADTIPECEKKNCCLNEKYRHYSRSEAISCILGDRMILHNKKELTSRRKRIDKFLKDIFEFTKSYLITLESSAWFFDDTKFNKKPMTQKRFWGMVTRRILEKLGFAVCAGCLYSAGYLWREVDVIEKYRKAGGSCRK